MLRLKKKNVFFPFFLRWAGLRYKKIYLPWPNGSICFLYTDHHSKYPAGLDSGPELPDLMNEVAAEIPSKWRVVGLRLGLDQGILDGIASISSGDTNLCYINVFSRWKNQNSTTYPYTWSTIVWALQAPAVGESRLAEKIKNKLTGQ